MRHRFCNDESFINCTKEHHGLELKITFDTKKNRDYYFKQLKNFLRSTNLNDKIIDSLDFEKVNGELSNAITETYGLHSVSVKVNGNKDGFHKRLLPEYPE